MTKYVVKPGIGLVKYLARDNDKFTWVRSEVPVPIINELLDRLDWHIDQHTNELESTNIRISLTQLTERTGDDY